MKLLFPLLLCFLFLSACSSEAIPETEPTEDQRVNETESNGDQYARTGIQAYRDRNYEQAEVDFKKALEATTLSYDRKEIYTLLGNAYNELEHFDSSIVYHKKALELDSNYVEAWVHLGIVYRLTAKFDQAENCYKRAHQIDPNDPELNASIGALYVIKGEPQKGISYLEKAIEKNEQLAVAHSNYALALAMVGRYDEADAELKRAVALGYSSGDIIKQRIENLKALDH
ncbi:MAG: tetratricopeptide repeat protein [Bacteroidetes bacterium]|nr:MAG: tetratricopeptide repeat protein [Bacteroidota bacterium]